MQLEVDEEQKLIRLMLLRIVEFFKYMVDNEEKRLFYVLPPLSERPYAYQHSSIRDVATICDILKLISSFKERHFSLPVGSFSLFQQAIERTVKAYCELYRDGLPSSLADGNIGDIGFFLIVLKRCSEVFPDVLLDGWCSVRDQLVDTLLQRQRSDGSFSIFFDEGLMGHEGSSEAFYLPEALLGLIEVSGGDIRVKDALLKACHYCCNEQYRTRHLTSEVATFYANWQFHLVYTLLAYGCLDAERMMSVKRHAEAILDAAHSFHIAREPFDGSVATVEVACYLEALSLAKSAFDIAKWNFDRFDVWHKAETTRCLLFLNEVQIRHLNDMHGGFVHSLYSHEARVDVAGHVFNALIHLPYAEFDH